MDAITFSETLFPNIPNVRKWLAAEGPQANAGGLCKLGTYCVAHARGIWLVRNRDEVAKSIAPNQRDLNSNGYQGDELAQGVIGWSVADGED